LLQSVPLNFSKFDCSKLNLQNPSTIVEDLKQYADQIELTLDVARCTEQEYLNELHRIFELTVLKTDSWLLFHETLHLLEILNNSNSFMLHNVAIINHRDKTGPLDKPFDINLLNEGTQFVKKGTCYCDWSELGKQPHRYWIDGEPNNLQRICELAKPWTTLRPRFSIALEDIDFTLPKSFENDFISWWKPYEQEWLTHWNLPKWTTQDMITVLPFGTINNVDQLTAELVSGNVPLRVVVD